MGARRPGLDCTAACGGSCCICPHLVALGAVASGEKVSVERSTTMKYFEVRAAGLDHVLHVT